MTVDKRKRKSLLEQGGETYKKKDKDKKKKKEKRKKKKEKRKRGGYHLAVGM